MEEWDFIENIEKKHKLIVDPMLFFRHMPKVVRLLLTVDICCKKIIYTEESITHNYKASC